MPRRLAVSVGFGGNPEQNKQILERIKVAEEVGVVVWAIREGRQAARAVDEFLMGGSDLPR